MGLKTIKNLFVIAALYDLVLGLAFLVAFKQIYAQFDIALPNHDGYVQFAAALVAIFGIGFWFVSIDPVRNQDIIKMGILLKLSYCSVAFFHFANGNIPSIWMPFAWCDLIFLFFFVGAFLKLKEL